MTVEEQHEGRAVGYRGDDRRPVDDEAWTLHHLVGGGLVLLAAVMAVVVTVGPARLATVVVDEGATAQVLLASMLAAVAFAHHRVTGRAHERGLAAAAVMLALQGGVAHLDVDGVLGAMLGLGAVCLLGLAVWGPEVDATSGARRSYLVTGLVAGACTVGVVVLSVGSTMAGVLLTVEGAAWAFVAGLGLARVRVRGWGFLAWGAWMALAYAGDGFLRVVGHVWDAEVGSPLLAVAGLAIATFGGVHEMARVSLARRGDVHALVLAQHTSKTEWETARRAMRHEIRNAVVAIDGAAMSVTLSGERLSREDRDRLHRTFQASIDGLRSLADPVPILPSEAYRLDEVVAARADVAALHGIRVVSEWSDPVVVTGDRSPIARVIDNLILNAVRHGEAGSDADPVVVRVEEGDGQVQVLVIDDGPGVAAVDRDRIFEANQRGHEGVPGDGLGLHVARDIARDQGGEVSYEAGPSGGACFVLALPTGRRSGVPAGGPGRHEVEDGREPFDAKDGTAGR